MFAALSRRMMRSSMPKVLHRASTFGKVAELALMTDDRKNQKNMDPEGMHMLTAAVSNDLQ